MREKGLLAGLFHLAARNPIKTALNIAAGVRADLNGFDKILAPALGISGAVFTATGVLYGDPLLGAAIGTPFVLMSAGIYNQYGETSRTVAHAASMKNVEPDVPQTEPKSTMETSPEKKTTSEQLAKAMSSQGSSEAGRYDTKIEFKPNLPRPESLGDGP